MMLISYAQNREDLLLHRCFADRTTGFYVDVGACHPVHESVTMLFYQKNWSGINIEPVPSMLKKLQRFRPRDINLGIAIAQNQSKLTLNIAQGYEALSSFHTQYAQNANNLGFNTISYEVETKPLKQVFEEQGVKDIQFLKVDVEGFEKDVLFSNDWQNWRPEVLVIEATVPGTNIPAWDEWEKYVFNQDYRFAYFDGLNRYYVREESLALLQYFETPLSILDPHTRLEYYEGLLEDKRHPDHYWAKSLLRQFLVGTAQKGSKFDFEFFTADLNADDLHKPSTEGTLKHAYQKVLGRDVDSFALEQWQKAGFKPSQAEIYNHLIGSNEYLIRRARVSRF